MIGPEKLRALACGALALTVLTLGSCMRKPVLYPVHGQLFVDNEPANGATVYLNPRGNSKGVRPYGDVDDTGEFFVSCYTSKDGAPPGDYVITVRWRGERTSGSELEGPDKLNGRYGDPSKSEFKVHVEPKANELEPIYLTTGSKQ